jgi:hypothetical protein
MSGPGDIDGEVSGDEAAWRDLIARFDTPADATLTEVPWPARESLHRPEATGPDPRGRHATPDAGQDRSSAGVSGSADDRAEPAIAPVDPALPPVPPVARPGARSGGYVSADGTRVIRPAGDPRSYSPPDEDDDRYVPTPLPPPARLDTASKAAVAGVIGGPGYLLIASVFLHWTISAEAAFVAVAAFIGGFVTLVLKLGDRPRRDDDDDGAVV